MQTIIITGASSGVGKEAARLIAAHHPDDRLILVGRNVEKTKAIATELQAEYLTADFGKLEDVRTLAAQIRELTDTIDVLANNAGGLFDGPRFTHDGFEYSFQVNHLAPMLLTNLLFDILQRSKATIVATSSIINRLGTLDLDHLATGENFRSSKAYAQGKLANILFTQELHRRYHKDGIRAVSFHPGVVASNFSTSSKSPLSLFYKSKLASTFGISSAEGGRRLAFFILNQSEALAASGTYYEQPLVPGATHAQAHDPAFAERFFTISSDLLKISWP